MKLIGLISDTHGFLDSRFTSHLQKCDEIWHAGDIGSQEVAEKLKEIAPLKAVFGNIDSHKIRLEFPENLRFMCEQVDIFIIYIPDAFTPNGDNINDAFGPSVYGIKEFEMKIYDRWGQIIYHTTEKDKPWDGTINNNETQAGVYTYSIVATDLKEKPHKYVGAFILIR